MTEDSRRLIDVIDEQLAEEKPALTPYDTFLMKYMARVTMWLQHYTGNKFKPFPIEFDGTNYHWLNREQRRRR